MQHKTRTLSAVSKFIIFSLSLLALVLQILHFGASAWRLLATYLLLLAIAFYFYRFFQLSFSSKLAPKDNSPLPVLNWSVITLGLLTFGFSLSYTGSGLFPALAAPGWTGLLTTIILPILFLLDWLVFAKKGQLRPADPFYFLVVPIFYFCLIILTAYQLPDGALFRYPYTFLDFSNPLFSLLWLVLTTIYLFAIGYFGYGLDCLLAPKMIEAPVKKQAPKKTPVKKTPVKKTPPRKPAPKVIDITTNKKAPRRNGGQGKKPTSKPKTSKTTGVKQSQRG